MEKNSSVKYDFKLTSSNMYNLKAVKRFMNVFEKLKLKDVGLVNDHHKMKVCKILFAKKNILLIYVLHTP